MSPTATTARIAIERRFNGPLTSANGGYACGRVARFVDGPATVVLRHPVPLDTPLDAERHDDGRVTLHHEGVLLAEGEPALPLDFEPPRRPSVAEALEAARRGYPGRPASASATSAPPTGRMGSGSASARWRPTRR